MCKGVKCVEQSVPGSKMIWEAKCSSALMQGTVKLDFKEQLNKEQIDFKDLPRLK